MCDQIDRSNESSPSAISVLFWPWVESLFDANFSLSFYTSCVFKSRLAHSSLLGQDGAYPSQLIRSQLVRSNARILNEHSLKWARIKCFIDSLNRLLVVLSNENSFASLISTQLKRELYIFNASSLFLSLPLYLSHAHARNFQVQMSQ